MTRPHHVPKAPRPRPTDPEGQPLEDLSPPEVGPGESPHEARARQIARLRLGETE